MNLEEQVKALREQVEALKSESRREKLFDVDPVMRPQIVGSMAKIYETDVPLYEYMSSQNLPIVNLSLGRLYKVIDDLGPVFSTPGQNGMITDTARGQSTCAHKIGINFCQRDFKAFRVAVEACVDDTDVDVPFVQGRDAQPEDAVSTVSEYRDVKLGEAMRQAKDFALAQGLGNANEEPESLETLVNQSTTSNIVDNAGQSAFEFALMALLAKIGLTSHSNSYVRQDGDMVIMTHPLIEWTMSRRANLPGLESIYEIRNGVVYFLGIPVAADRNFYINATTNFGSIFVLKRNYTGLVEYYDTDREVEINEQNSPTSGCEEDCLRLYNYMTGLAKGVPVMGRVINVKPMLINTVISGLTGQLNQPNAGTGLGSV